MKEDIEDFFNFFLTQMKEDTEDFFNFFLTEMKEDSLQEGKAGPHQSELQGTAGNKGGTSKATS
jgi:hypothetical protein